jgi:hypothetical protein
MSVVSVASSIVCLGVPSVIRRFSVPVDHYLVQHNLYQHSLTKLDFMKGVLFIDDVAVIGYRDPRPD